MKSFLTFFIHCFINRMIVEQNGKMYRPSIIYRQILLIKELFLNYLVSLMVFTINFLSALVCIGIIVYIIGGAVLIIYLICMNEKVGFNTADNKNNYDHNHKWMHEISDVYILQLVIMASLIGFCILACGFPMVFSSIQNFLFILCYEEIVNTNNMNNNNDEII